METLEPFNIIYQTAEDGLGDTVKPRLIEADADLERVLVIDYRDIPLTLADERIARAIRENNAKLVIIDPVQAFLGADDVERLKGLHTGQRLSIGASRRKTHGKVGFALAGVALYDGQLSEWDIRKP